MGRPLADRVALVNAGDRPVLPRDLAGTVAHAGVDPTLEGRALQDALQAASATHRGYCFCDVDQAGWVVTLPRLARATGCGPQSYRGIRRVCPGKIRSGLRI